MDFAKLPEDLRNRAVNTVRFLSIDAVEKANSGHPGLPMGCADMAFVLWSRFLNFDPKNPDWRNRDRFVLSAGHGSMLLYSLLHLTGYDLPMSELERFRQWGSRTAGHPEKGITPGVEVTTGPLGQGFAHGVGMALAGKHLGARLNTADFSPFDYTVWGIVSDGDLMEGVAAEAASLAGHLRLGNLIYLYDSNKITIDGSTDITFTEDTGARFESYGWHVEHVDGNDHEAVADALARAKAVTDRPSLIIARTTIGFGSPAKAGKSSAHGSPLGAAETKATREALGWTNAPFEVDDDVRTLFEAMGERGAKAHLAWREGLAAWGKANPEKAAEYEGIFAKPPADLAQKLIAAAGEGKASTRVIGGKVVNEAARLLPGLVGGSADLDASTMTFLKDMGVAQPGTYEGRNVHFGIREHAMAAVVNGLTLSGLRAFGATFLVFSDYARPSLRLAALMREPSVFVFTHDSVYLGEDGPTHQPIEHVGVLRAIPHMQVWRPADARETALAWTSALERTDGPTSLALTRQNLPPLTGERAEVPETADEAAAYICHEPGEAPEAVIVATGSEVHVAIEAAKQLATEGRALRVVSMPCVERFFARSRPERARLLPPGVRVITVEAGWTAPWHRIAGIDGLTIGIDDFGHSAPAEVVAEHLGLTGEKVARRIAEWLAD